MDLRDFIVTVPNVMSDDVCDRIVEYYKMSDRWKQAMIAQDGNPKAKHGDDRTCSSIETQHDPRIDTLLFEAVSKGLMYYGTLYPTLGVKQDTGYEILRYEPGQQFITHTDSYHEEPRIITLSLSLNDDYTGGEWSFFYDEFRMTVPKGSAVLFPSNFMYPHAILPVIEGTRYSIVTWFR